MEKIGVLRKSGTNETVFRYKWSATKEYLHKNERRIVSLKRLHDYFSPDFRKTPIFSIN